MTLSGIQQNKNKNNYTQITNIKTQLKKNKATGEGMLTIMEPFH